MSLPDTTIIGIVNLPFQRNSLAVTPLDDSAVVALPAGHALAARQVITAADLRGQDMIVLSHWNSGPHSIGMALSSVPHRQVIETRMSTVACALVAEGMGITIVDPFSASDFVGRNVVLRRFKPASIIGTAMVHSVDRELSITAREFQTEFIAHTNAFLRKAAFLQP